MKLITFDRNKNVNYFGDCKLQFNGIDKCLNLKILDKDPEETLTATFNRIFICKNNLLCSMNQNLKNGMILVFSTRDKCEQIFDGILKVKSRQSQTNNTVVNEEEMFKTNFYRPLVKAVESNCNGCDDLKMIILDFVDSLENDERSIYFNYLPDTLTVKSAPKNDKVVVNPINGNSTSETSSNDNETPSVNEPTYSMRKRRNISYNENVKIPRKKSNVSVCNKRSARRSNSDGFDEPTPKNSPDNVYFDIVGFLQNGIKKLLVFTSKERKQCYEFIFNGAFNYRCVKCLIEKKNVSIKRVIHDDGSQTFDFNHGQHICEPLNYLPENYQSSLIIKSPNLKFIKRERNGKIKNVLVIFDSKDKSLCYRFGFDCTLKFYYCYNCKSQGRNVTARFIQFEGKTTVELGRLEHICKPVKYIP